MTRQEVAGVLAMVSALDGRRAFGEVDVIAWEAVIGDLRFEDAREAVVEHYKDETVAMMPAHVRKRVATIRAARRRSLPMPESPYAATDVLAHIEWQRMWDEAIGDGMAARDAYDRATQQVARMLTTPEDNRE